MPLRVTSLRNEVSDVTTERNAVSEVGGGTRLPSRVVTLHAPLSIHFASLHSLGSEQSERALEVNEESYAKEG